MREASKLLFYAVKIVSCFGPGLNSAAIGRPRRRRKRGGGGKDPTSKRRTMFEMAPKRSESNFGWQPFFSSSWQTLYSKTLQFYYVKLTSHNF